MRRPFAAVVACALAAAVSACGGSAPAGAPEAADLPSATGPHPMGRVALHWTDRSRAEEWTADPADRREVAALLFYPAAAAGGEPGPYVPDLDALGLETRTAAFLRAVRGGAVDGAPPAAAPAPLVVLSPGNDTLAAQYTALAEELASHGFAVAAIDHPFDSRAVRLADGSAVAHDSDRWPPLPPPRADGRPVPDSAYAAFYRSRVVVRAADARFAVDRLAEDAPAGLTLDLGRVAFVGHSVGGVAAGEVCATDPRVDACVNLDGDSGLGPFTLRAGGRAFDQPYALLTKPFSPPDDLLRRWGMTRAEWTARVEAERRRFLGAVRGGAERVVFPGATHSTFSDEPVALALIGQGDAREAALTASVRAYVLAFLSRHLLGAAPAPAPAGVEVTRY